MTEFFPTFPALILVGPLQVSLSLTNWLIPHLPKSQCAFLSFSHFFQTKMSSFFSVIQIHSTFSSTLNPTSHLFPQIILQTLIPPFLLLLYHLFCIRLYLLLICQSVRVFLFHMCMPRPLKSQCFLTLYWST